MPTSGASPARAAHRSAADEPISLGDLADEAGLSPYHFLRSFRRVAGMTPYQFVLRTRLNRAAVRLRTSGDAVSAIAFDAGFNDLSTFNRRFRRVMGQTPSAYRARRTAASGRNIKRAERTISEAGRQSSTAREHSPARLRRVLVIAHICLK